MLKMIIVGTFLLFFAGVAFGCLFIILKIDKGYTNLIEKVRQALKKQNENQNNLNQKENGN